MIKLLLLFEIILSIPVKFDMPNLIEQHNDEYEKTPISLETYGVNVDKNVEDEMKLIKIDLLSDVMIENIEYNGNEFFNITNFSLQNADNFCFIKLNPLTFTFNYFQQRLCISQPYRTSTWFFENCKNTC